jgi:hypothetical protein
VVLGHGDAGLAGEIRGTGVDVEPWLVSNTPLSVVVTGCGRTVLTTAAVAASWPTLASAPRTGKDLS